jgi:trk system potassium uptake protein TrkA
MRSGVHIIVVGCGNVGVQLGTLLASEAHDVVLIDKDPRAFKRLGAAFNGVTISGYGFDEEVLKQAGIEKCDAFAAVTDQDNSNIMAAEVASKIYRVPRVVTRLYDAERASTAEQLGLDYVCETSIVAQMILERLVNGQRRGCTPQRELPVIEFIAGPAAAYKRVADIEIPRQFRICLVGRGGSHFVPDEDTLLRARDTILAGVAEQAREHIRKYMREA